jgi:hypothetical protein
MDFLEVAPYLPQAMLPSSFNRQPRQVAVNTTPSAPAASATTAPTETEPAETETAESLATRAPSTAATAPQEPAEFAASEPAESADDTPEMPASYTDTPTSEPTPEVPSPQGDRYAIAATETESESPDVQPLEAETTQEAPLTDLAEAFEPSSAAVEEVRPSNSPSFTVDELSSALEAAKEAQSSLVAGNLSDSKQVAKAKGYGYSTLADLAQKAAFVEASAPADTTQPLQQATDELFRQTLSDEHTRNEVAVILPKWLASPNRKHGGAFFAATLSSPESKGSVTECRAELASGESITVLVPASAADQLADTSRPVAILGWVLDQPTEQVSGYSGDARQAIWASRLIPLP